MAAATTHQRLSRWTFMYAVPETSDFVLEEATVEAVDEDEARSKAARKLPFFPVRLVSVEETRWTVSR